jgi:hypothetical protein
MDWKPETMSETPKFTVIDRRKFKAEEEQETQQTPQPETAPAPVEPSAGPRLVVTEPVTSAAPEAAAEPETEEMPPAPTAEESLKQKTAYPGVGAQPPVSFEHLVQQFYVSAMIQMGAGTQEGQRPHVDILGARNTIDLLGVLAEKTRGNLTEAEERTLETVLFEVRMAFLELTSMVSLQGVQPPTAPPPGKR